MAGVAPTRSRGRVDGRPRLCAAASSCIERPERILFASSGSFSGVVGRVEVALPVGLGGRVSVVVGFGSDCSEEPGHVRCDAGHAGFSDVLALSSRAHLASVVAIDRRLSIRVVDQLRMSVMSRW